jgi:glycosyltransferase involved in cell wall biosynthesis
MHFGKPVFLSRLTSLPEVGGDVAHYFDSFDGQAMRQVVEAGLRADAAPDRADAITRHARQFSWQRCAQAHIALYAQVLQARAGAPA